MNKSCVILFPRKKEIAVDVWAPIPRCLDQILQCYNTKTSQILIANIMMMLMRGRFCWTLSAFLSTQKSPQKSKPTQKSTLESKSTFLSPQKSVQKSFIDQKSAQESALVSDQLKKVLKKEWVTQKS